MKHENEPMKDYNNRMKEYIRDLIRNELAVSDDSDNENQSQLSEKAKRDYKAEYKKFQSSTKMKKYRAELNKYNRKKGTYGNGDNKDASHKGGKIVGFEAQSKNRGRAEKSRLKKEDLKKLVKTYGVEKVLEACQKGYMTHPTRKTKIMFGKRYRNCVKKENVKEYTYGVGDIVKDINPTCPHNGAMGKVRSVSPKSVVFVVLNRGKNYKPGDVLDKTHDQMKKIDESLKSRMKDVMKGLAKSMKLKSVVSMHTGSGSFSYFMDDKMEAKKLAMSLKKHLKRVRLIPLDKSKGDTANFVVAADVFGINENSAEKKKILKLMIKYGDKPKDAKKDLAKHYKKAKGDRSKATPSQLAQYISYLSANESVNEGVSKSQAKTIMKQLGGRKFEMLMGVKSKGVGKDGLILHIGRNPKKVSHIIIDLDRGKDLYNVKFGKVFKYKFKIIKNLKGVGVEQLHDMIEKYTGLFTTFRPR
tara:strand:+ start:2891 stop:4306 length:1416 start_codon:yes stop_codon:yes gene_type:complete